MALAAAVLSTAGPAAIDATLEGPQVNAAPDPSGYAITYARHPAALDPGTVVPPPTGCDLR